MRALPHQPGWLSLPLGNASHSSPCLKPKRLCLYVRVPTLRLKTPRAIHARHPLKGAQNRLQVGKPLSQNRLADQSRPADQPPGGQCQARFSVRAP